MYLRHFAAMAQKVSAVFIEGRLIMAKGQVRGNKEAKKPKQPPKPPPVPASRSGAVTSAGADKSEAKRK